MPDAARQIAVALVECDGCILVGRRSESASLAGYAEFPGGKVEAGESIAAAAARECLEETGLAVDAQHVLCETHRTYDHGSVHLHFVMCKPRDGGAAPREPFRWIPRPDIKDLRFPPANAAVLALLTAETPADDASAIARETPLGERTPSD